MISKSPGSSGRSSADPVTQPPIFDLVGKKIGKYQIESFRGQGAFGIVFLAKDLELNRRTALKVPRLEVLLDSERLRRFRREAEIASQLNHQGIVPIYEARLTGKMPFIASAFCEGIDLAEWLGNRTCPVAPKEAVRFIRNVADALQYAHSQGVIHRDLKPANILLEWESGEDVESLADVRPRVTDFGLAKLLNHELTDSRSSMVIGTPGYLAPEQLESAEEKQTPAIDQYAIGVILFELLTLRTPFQNFQFLDWVHWSQSTQPLDLSRCDIPDQIAAICEKCIHVSPADRYESVNELIEDLDLFLDDQPPIALSRRKSDSPKHRFIQWCREPARISQAGWAAMLTHLFIMAWIAVVLGGALWFVLDKSDVARFLRDAALVTTTAHLPIIGCGWALTGKRKWAFWPSLSLNVLMTWVFIYSAFSADSPFHYIYQTPFSKFIAYSAFIMSSSLVVLLHLIAIPARVRQNRR